MNIYPEGHKGGYTLEIKENPNYMSVGSFKCPVCNADFKSLKIREVKLMALKVTELRTTYKDIEPLYHGVTTCPKCRYSAQTSMFGKSSAPRRRLLREKLEALAPHLPPYQETLTADVVFERYYLTLQCYSVGFSDKELLEAGVWLRLSSLYSDAGDENMELYAAGEAQKAYIAAFQKLSISPMKYPSLNLRIGLLSAKIGDTKTARDFFYKVKTDYNSTRLQKDAADDAVEELKAHGEG